MYKGSLGLNIPIIGRVITIWYEVLFKLRAYFDGLVSREKAFADFSHRIETHIDVIVEVHEAQSSVSFYLCLDDELI